MSRGINWGNKTHGVKLVYQQLFTKILLFIIHIGIYQRKEYIFVVKEEKYSCCTVHKSISLVLRSLQIIMFVILTVKLWICSILHFEFKIVQSQTSLSPIRSYLRSSTIRYFFFKLDPAGLIVVYLKIKSILFQVNFVVAVVANLLLLLFHALSEEKKNFLGNYFAQQGFSFFKMIKQKQDLNDFSEFNNVVFLFFLFFFFFFLFPMIS